MTEKEYRRLCEASGYVAMASRAVSDDVRVEVLLRAYNILDKLTNQLAADPWKEDPAFPVCDWQAEVANDDTHSGYLDWVEHQKVMLTAND